MCPSSLKARPIELNPECPRKSQTQNLGRIIILKIYVTEDSEVWVSGQFSSVVQLCLTLCNPMDCSTPGFLSITNFWSLLKRMTIESMMPSNHLILCLPLLLPSIFPSISVFSNKSVLRIRWPKYWSFSFNINPSSEYSGLISFRMHWLDHLAVQGPQVFSNTTVQKHQFFSAQFSL